MMNEYGLYAAMLHLIFHSFAKITIFFIAGGLMHNADVIYVDQVDGLAKKMPLTFVSYILAGLSIVGIPMFAGFISKFEIAAQNVV
jgi:multicomponent Na+:H+ antiporter subunit D